MLMARSGRSLLAIDAMSVHATLSAPVLAPSVLGRGHCLGVLEHAGLKIPRSGPGRPVRLRPRSARRTAGRPSCCAWTRAWWPAWWAR